MPNTKGSPEKVTAKKRAAKKAGGKPKAATAKKKAAKTGERVARKKAAKAKAVKKATALRTDAVKDTSGRAKGRGTLFKQPQASTTPKLSTLPVPRVTQKDVMKASRTSYDEKYHDVYEAISYMLAGKTTYKCVLLTGPRGNAKTTFVQSCLDNLGFPVWDEFAVVEEAVPTGELSSDLDEGSEKEPPRPAPPVQQHRVIGGHITPLKFFESVQDANSPNTVLVFDDADKVITNKDSLGLLKSAVDDKQLRRMNYRSAAKAASGFRALKVEPYFIIITNQQLKLGANLDPDLDALLDRVKHIKLSLTLDEYLAKVERDIVPQPFGDSTLDQRTACFRLIKKAAIMSPESFSLRSFRKLLPFYLESPERFQRHLDLEFPRDTPSAILVSLFRRYRGEDAQVGKVIRDYAKRMHIKERQAYNHYEKFQWLIEMSLDADQLLK